MALSLFLSLDGVFHRFTYIKLHSARIYPEAHTAGQALVEYALLLGLLASLVLSVVTPAGSALSTIFTQISMILAAAASPGCPPSTFCIN